MTDFEDEPAAGAGDDIWDDEPAPRAAKPAKRRPVADEDWDEDWDDEPPRRGGRDLTLVYAIIAAAVIIVVAVVLTRPKDDAGSDAGSAPAGGATTTAIQKNWQGPVGADIGEGGSQIQARIAGEDGVFIWTDFEGWHVRAKQAGETTVVVRAETVTDKEKGGDPAGELTVTLPAGGDGTTGADLDLGGSETATFEVSVDGTPVGADVIKVGGGDAVADANPVTFTKA